MKYNNPMNASLIELMVGKMGILPEHRLLEIGCGEGALLELVAQRYSCSGLGVDIDCKLIDTAQNRLAAIGSSIVARCESADISNFKSEKFNHAVCIGSSGAFGNGCAGVENTLSAMNSLLPTSGMFLLGELYWKKTPAAEIGRAHV